MSLEGRFLQVNPKLCEVPGRDEGELLAGAFRDVTNGEDRESSGAGLQSLLESGRPSLGLEKRYLQEDGSIVGASVIVAPLRAADGSLEAFVSVVEGITARKEAEERARRMARLYGALSATNRAIVHSSSREELYARV